MDYEYDIFISYRRDDLTKAWIEKIFIPPLRSHVFYELGFHPPAVLAVRSLTSNGN